MSIVKNSEVDSLLSGISLKIPVLPVSSAAPLKGRLAYDTATNQFEYANGTSWVSPISSVVGGVLTGTLPDPGLAVNTVTVNDIANGTIIATNLANTGVVAGIYGDNTHTAEFTVNPQGQITSASSVAIVGGTVTDINTGTGLTGGPITTTGTISLSNTTVTPGTYGSTGVVPIITVNQQGQITGITTAGTPAGTPLISRYAVTADVVVPNANSIIFNSSFIEQTGSMNLTTGVFTISHDGIYSITFYGLALHTRGQYQMLLNGAFPFGTPIRYCEGGNDASIVPDMTAVITTASMTIVKAFTSGNTIQVANVSAEDIEVKGYELGTATAINIIKL